MLDSGTLPFGHIKTGVAERLMLGVSNTSASAGNTQQFSSKAWGATHNACHGVGCQNVDQVDRSFESSMMQENVKLYVDNTVVSERFSIHKLSDVHVDSHKVLSSDNLNSEWDHFPMFEINRKIDSILNPRRSEHGSSPNKPFISTNTLKVNMCTSNVMTFSSEEYQFRSCNIANENMTKCRSVGGILSRPDNHIDINSGQAGRKLKLKGLLSIEESCSCSKNETNSLCSFADKRCSSNHTVNSDESPHWSSENRFLFPASRKNNLNFECTLREKKSAASEVCQKQQDFGSAAFHGPIFCRKNEMKLVNALAAGKGNDGEHSGHCVMPANLLHLEHESAHRMNPAVKLTESCSLLNTIPKTLALKSKNETLDCGKGQKEKITDGERKATFLFEMLTLPSKSQATGFQEPTSLGRSCHDIGSTLLSAQKHVPTKTNSDTKNMSGFAATSVQKDCDRPSATKTGWIAASTKGEPSCSRGNENLNINAENHNSHSKATCGRKEEWSISKTSNMNVDLVLFQISRMRNPISSAPVKSPVCSEPSDKWLKRLQHDISDPCFPCSKRSKVGDGSSPGRTCAVFAQDLHNETSKSDMTNHLKPDEQRNRKLMNQRNQEGPPVLAKCFNHWIGRWCQGGSPIFHGTSNAEKQTAKSNVPSDDLEDQFPSIAAMAMMGRVMNKLRPCEFQRKGPSIVWKT